MNSYTFSLSVIGLAILAALGYFASRGSIAAGVTLAVIVTALLISLGAIITLAVTRTMSNQAQKAFTDNAQENLAIMQQLQKVQNQQNTALMQQVARLPQPLPGVRDSLLIEDGIFDELDN